MRLYMVELRVRSLSDCLPWYRDVLGFEVDRVDEPHGWALLKLGDFPLSMKQGEPNATGVDLVFVLGDVDAAVSTWKARGVRVSEPFDSPLGEGYREARLFDPEGRRVRVFSWRMVHG